MVVDTWRRTTSFTGSMLLLLIAAARAALSLSFLSFPVPGDGLSVSQLSEELGMKCENGLMAITEIQFLDNNYRNVGSHNI